jgi:hypothetical protein
MSILHAMYKHFSVTLSWGDATNQWVAGWPEVQKMDALVAWLQGCKEPHQP